MGDWSDYKKLKTWVSADASGPRSVPPDEFKRRSLDGLAKRFGLERRIEEPDNALFARIESLPEYQKLRDSIIKQKKSEKEVIKPEVDWFMDELRKI